MSWQAVRWVLKNAKTGSLSNRVVLIVLADHADRDGMGSRPSVKTIAEEAEISERQAHYCLRSLEESGHIRRTGKVSRGVSVWTIPMSADSAGVTYADSAPMQILQSASHDTRPMQPPADKRTTERSLVSANALTPKPRKRDPLWDVLAAELGEPQTRSERGRRNSALRELREIGATPADLQARIATYRKEWPEVTLTATAVVANWTVLANGNGHGDPDAAKQARIEAQMREINARRRADEERRNGASPQ